MVLVSWTHHWRQDLEGSGHTESQAGGTYPSRVLLSGTVVDAPQRQINHPTMSGTTRTAAASTSPTGHGALSRPTTPGGTPFTPGGTHIGLPTTTAPLTVPSTRISNAHATTFSIPPGVNLPRFDGTSWPHWSGTLEAILSLYEADDVIYNRVAPLGADPTEFATIERQARVYLRLYIQPDIYSHIKSNMDYPTFADKWDRL